MKIGKMEDFTIDQFAGSLALILGSISSLLLIIWKSRCECDMNCCYIWRCHRRPPPDENGGSDEEQTNIKKKKDEVIIPVDDPSLNQNASD